MYEFHPTKQIRWEICLGKYTLEVCFYELTRLRLIQFIKSFFVNFIFAEIIT
jgi:hypothetical protein